MQKMFNTESNPQQTFWSNKYFNEWIHYHQNQEKSLEFQNNLAFIFIIRTGVIIILAILACMQYLIAYSPYCLSVCVSVL